MKKLMLTALTIMTCGAAYALPLGNPSEASMLCDGLFLEGGCCPNICDICDNWCDAFSVRLGFYGDYVFNRHMENDTDITLNRGQVEHFEIYTNAAYIALNVCDRIDLFTTLGSTTMREETGLFAPGGRFVVESTPSFSWSIGARGTLFQCGRTSLGVEGQYFQNRSHVMRATAVAATSDYADNTHDMNYREWQLGFGISYRIWNLMPYIGAKGGRGWLKYDSTPLPNLGSLIDLQTRFNGGYVIGVSLIDCEKAAITVEFRAPDEKAVHVNGQIRF